MIYPKYLRLLWLVTVAATSLTSVNQVAAAARPIHLKVAECSDFHEAVTALSEQGKVVIVAEGVPLHPHLSQQDAGKLTVAASLDDEMKAIAVAYDYSVQRVGDVFVLKKLYSIPNDLPTLTQAECDHVLMLMPRVVEPFNPHGLSYHIQFLAPPGPQLRRDQTRIVHPLVDSFATSLTPNQLAMMEKNVLLVSSLSQSQKALARQLRFSLYLQEPMDRIALLPPILKQAEQSAVFCWQDTRSARHVFGYTLPDHRGDRTLLRFHPLSHSTGGEDLDTFSPDPQATGPDPTDPSSLPVQAETPAAQTLAEAVAALNTRSVGAIHADVDAAVAAKPVTLAGANNAPASQVLHALADVYGLRLVDTPGSPGKLTLTLPDVPPPSELADLPSSLRQALPDPFVRATHLDKIVAAQQQFYDFWQLPRDPKHLNQASRAPGVEETQAELEQAMLERKRANSDNVDFKAGLDRIKEAQAALPALRFAAIRRLRALVEPKLQAKPDGVALSDLGEPEHEAIATIFLVEATQSLGDLITQAVPDTVLHFDQDTLGGGIQANSQPPSFTVQFHMPNSAGGLEVNGGGIGVTYNKDYGKGDDK